jgi:hypothetical protein
MYQVINGCAFNDRTPSYFHDVFLFGEEGIPLQGNLVVNRFTNFCDDQLLIWLLHHQNRELVGIDGVTLPLYGDWGGNFWHWCYEALPVALAAHEGGFSGNYLVPDLPFAAESLQLLGIRPDRVIRAGACDYHLKCMCLFNKVRGSDPAMLPALSRIRSIFRSRFADPRAEHRVYLSRNGHPDTPRRVVNDSRLTELLEQFGFITLHLEKMSLEEQLSHTCNATALIGPHGAGMTHCSFLPENSLVLELFAPSYVNPCVLFACRELRHRYYQITSSCLHVGYPHGQDILASLQIIELTLDRELR